MRSTRSAAVAMAATFSLVLAGCGGGDTGSSGGGGNEALTLPGVDEYFNAPCPEVGTKPATDKEFTYWSMWTADEPQGKVLAKAIKCFTEKTGVKVDVQWLGRKLLTQNVAPSLNTDTVPDLFDQDISQVKAAIVAPGGTQSVEDVLDYKIGEGEKKVRDVLPATSYDIPQNKGADGKIFEIPYELLGNAWWYNKDLVKDLQPPKTMDELFSLFDKAKADGIGAVAQDGDINFYNAYFFTQLGARYVGAGGLEKAAMDKTGQAWNDPGLLKAAELVEKLAKGGYFVDGWDAAKFPQIQQRWADGDAGYLFVGSWGPSETREYLNKQGGDKGITYGSFQFPMPDGATHKVVEQLPIGFAVTAKAKHPEAAKAFMAYMLNKDILSGIPAVADNLTPRADLPVPDSLKDVKVALEDSGAEHAIFMDGLDGLAAGKWVDNVFYPLNNDLLRGKITAKQFIDGLAAKQIDFWKTTS
ncbi:MAG: ABC transporter substrate-binding protein [Actinomycetota bacterium]|nr:ABC transporter substrate-binding protein [Actinomycetota bacterium]